MTEENFGSNDPVNPANNGAQQPQPQPQAQGNWNQNPNPYGQPNQAPQQDWNQQAAPQQGQNAYGAPQNGQNNFQNQQGFNGQNGQTGQFDIKQYLDFSNKSVIWMLCAAAAALISLIGSFMPWGKVTVPFYGTITVSGTDGDGMLTMFLSLILIGGIAAYLFVEKLTKMWWRGIPVIAIGAVLLLISVMDWTDIGSKAGQVDKDVAQVSVGAGLILILLASIAIIAFGVLTLLNDRKNSPAVQQAGFGQPQQGYGQPQQGYGQQPQNNFDQNNNYGQPQQNGFDQNNFGQQNPQ